MILQSEITGKLYKQNNQEGKIEHDLFLTTIVKFA